MKDDLEANAKFIELVKERPCLYDFDMAEYNNRFAQDLAWTEIAKIVDEPGVLAVHCRERWKNLRGCYTRHLKNVFRQSTSSSGKLVKPYYLAKHLQFLDHYTRPKYQSAPSLTIKIERTAVEETPFEEFLEEDNQDDEAPPPSPLCDIKEEPQEAGNQDVEPLWIPSKRPRNTSASDTLEYLKADNTISQEKYENQDPDLAFLYSLLPDVKDMTREQKRRFKMGALKLVSDILKENQVSS